MKKQTVKSALTRIAKNKTSFNLPPLTGREMLEIVKMQCPNTNVDFEDVFGHQISMHELDTMLEGFMIVNQRFVYLIQIKKVMKRRSTLEKETLIKQLNQLERKHKRNNKWDEQVKLAFNITSSFSFDELIHKDKFIAEDLVEQFS